MTGGGWSTYNHGCRLDFCPVTFAIEVLEARADARYYPAC